MPTSTACHDLEPTEVWSTAIRNQERLARLTLQLVHHAPADSEVTVRRTVGRMTSVLMSIAALVAIYDLTLFAH